MWTILVYIATLFAVAAIMRVARRHEQRILTGAKEQRIQALLEARLTTTLDVLRSGPAPVCQVVRIDLGFGDEFWALTDRRDPAFYPLYGTGCSPRRGVVEGGLLIWPSPQPSDVEDFARQSGSTFRHILFQV
jgi:hypothetical protein